MVMKLMLDNYERDDDILPWTYSTMEFEFDDAVVEVVVAMMVVKIQLNHCREKQRWMTDIEEQLDVNLLHQELFENHRLTSCWMLLMR